MAASLPSVRARMARNREVQMARDRLLPTVRAHTYEEPLVAAAIEVLREREICGKEVHLITIFGSWFIADELGALARCTSRSAIVDWALEVKYAKCVNTKPKPDFSYRDE